MKVLLTGEAPMSSVSHLHQKRENKFLIESPVCGQRRKARLSLKGSVVIKTESDISFFLATVRKDVRKR